MLESGIVMQIKDKTMVVEFERSEMCAKCGACQHGQKQAMLMEVQRIGNAAIGDKVQVQLPEKTLLKASFIAYGIPLVMLVAGLLGGSYLAEALKLPGNAEHYAALLGLAMAALSFLIIRLTEKRRGESGIYAPKVVSVEKGCFCAQYAQKAEE